ncbi:hypothetical protein NFI96_008270, partial [Prochilodus magdalenae]
MKGQRLVNPDCASAEELWEPECSCFDFGPVQPFISVQLNKGALEVLVFTGSKNTRRAIRKPEEGILHDGKEHSLRIRRHSGGSFSVQVDEETRLEHALPSNHPISIHRLFIGGVPDDVPTGLQRPSVAFEGCIWNLLINT